MLKQTLFAWWLPFCFCCCFQFCVGAVLFYILSDVFFKAPFNIVFFKTPSNHHLLKCVFVSVCIESGSSPMLKSDIFNILRKYSCWYTVSQDNGRKYFPFLIKRIIDFFFWFFLCFSFDSFFKKHFKTMCRFIGKSDQCYRLTDWCLNLLHQSNRFKLLDIFCVFIVCILFIYFDTSTVTIIGNISVFRVFLSKHSQWFSVIHFREIERFSQSKFKCTFSK